MNWLSLLPLFLLGLANFVIAGLVWSRDFHKLNNRAFGAFVFGIGIWVVGIAGFFLVDQPSAAQLWARLYYFGPLLIALSGYYFASTFPGSNKVSDPFLPVVITMFVAMTGILAVFPDLFMAGVVYHSWGKEILLQQPIYGLYSLFILASFAVILVKMLVKSRKLHGLYRIQARLFFQSLTIAAIFGLLFNLLLPLFHNYRLIGLGPLFTSVSVLGIGYSIAKHKMFDVRLIVVRSFAYALSIAVVALVYGGVSYLLTNYALDIVGSDTAKTLVQIPLIVLVAVTFEPLRRLFNRISNSIFYRDAYDPQELFSQLNNKLVSSLDAKYLMMQSISIIETALKPDYALIGIKDGADNQRIFASRKLNFAHEDLVAVRKITPKTHQKVIIADHLEDGKFMSLRELMQQNNVSVIVRLTQDLRRSAEGFGYLVLGPKKSGNPYSEQDAKVLETVGDELTIAIQNALHYEEIQQFNVELQSKVDEATRKLRRTNDKLKSLDETKDDFISMASHQLRTPLTSVKGYLSMVLEGDAGTINDTQRKMLGQAFTSSQRMVYLIADLLNVSRLRTGKFVIEPVETDLSEMIQEELAQLVETAAARDLELTYKKPKDFPILMLDETKTRQVIMNFVDNAIYYTPSGGHIKVQLTSDDQAAELRVVDDGIGVPKSEQHHLFTKFYRAGNARKARPDGTGLGLFMAKKVIVAQNGSVIFDSKDGEGSTFGFRFPLSKITTTTVPVTDLPASQPAKK